MQRIETAFLASRIIPGRRHALRGKAALMVAAAVLAAGLMASAVSAQPENWPVLPETFESTGGGGWMITQYRPVVDGAVCKTDFVTVSPDGKDTYPATVEWTAMPRDGGIYCAAGKWRTKDGSGSGTTPLEVFIRDGVVRRVM